jgi:thiamine pyrophosphate-dependent acetolactate synthase large subunit-like protein
LTGIRIDNVADYADALRQAADSSETTVIDALVDPDAHPPITMFENKAISRWADRAESMA